MEKSKKVFIYWILFFFAVAVLRFIFKYFIYEGSLIKELLISFGYFAFFSFIAGVNYFCKKYNESKEKNTDSENIGDIINENKK